MAKSKAAGQSGGAERWFREQMKLKGLSFRKLGALLALDGSAVSRRVDGTYKWTTSELGALARVFNVPLEDVARHAGVDVPRETSRAVRVVGVADAGGSIADGPGGGPRHVDRPDGRPDDMVAICFRPPGAAGHWVLFVAPRKGVDPEAVGKPALVETAAGTKYLATIVAGHERGRWALQGIFGGADIPGMASADVVSASPVLWIKP